MTKYAITKRAAVMSASILGCLLGIALTINAYANPSAPVLAADATGYVIKFRVKPGKNADFEKAVGEMMAAVRKKEPKNLYCDLLHTSGDAQSYVIVERYKDVEASKEHGESDYIKKLGVALQNGVLDGAPELQELVFIRSKSD